MGLYVRHEYLYGRHGIYRRGMVTIGKSWVSIGEAWVSIGTSWISIGEVI